MADDPTAGTTTPAAADPAATPGTTAEAVADGKTGAEAAETPEQKIARLEADKAETQRKFDELLRNKSNYEGWERERDALLARLQPPMPDGGQSDVAARLQEAQLVLQQEAAAGDSKALAMLVMMGALQQQPAMLRQEFELREVPGDDRKEVERIQRESWEQRQERITPGTARKLLDAERLQKQAADVKRREDELRRTEEARKQGVVATRPVGVPASELRDNQPMTYSAFRQAMANAKTDAERDELIKRTAGGTKGLVPG